MPTRTTRQASRSNSSITGGSTAGVDNGVIMLTGGELTIAANLTLDGDTNGDTGADITVDASFGSRVFDISSGAATIEALTITHGYGSGVRVGAAGYLTLVNSTVADNYSSSAGGGIVNYGGATLVGSTLTNNISDHGGGLANFGTATLVNVTIADNDGVLGAGIYNGTHSGSTGTLTLVSSTVSGNGPADYGGGIYNDGNATLINSIVAGNGADYSGADIRTTTSGGTTIYSGVNIFSQAGAGDAEDHSGIAAADVFAATTVAGGGVLADNGGPVETIAILQGGLAQNAGDDSFLSEATAGVDLNGDGDTSDTIATDARGEARVAIGHTDIGAYEIQTLIVTTLDDEAAGSTDLATEAADGNGLSFREALAIANAAAGHDTIVFDASLTGGSTSGVDDGVVTLSGVELTISSDLTIDGDANGDGRGDITINGGGISRVLNVTGGTSTLESLTITHGYGTDGAGIHVGGGADLTVVGSTIAGNSASYVDGGGIWNAGVTTLIDSTVSGNDGGFGGGIYNKGTATLVGTTLSGNTATTGGGGGLYDNGTATLTNTTVSGNSSHASGAGIQSFGSLTLTNTTVSGNHAMGSGGGVQSFGSGLITNSIVAGNDATASDNDISGTGITYSGVDLFSQVGAGDAQDIVESNLANIFVSVGADPYTGVTSGLLADNGGPVETIAILRGGAAANAGDDSFLSEATAGVDLNGDGDTSDTIATDARGFARVAFAPHRHRCLRSTARCRPGGHDAGRQRRQPDRHRRSGRGDRRRRRTVASRSADPGQRRRPRRRSGQRHDHHLRRVARRSDPDPRRRRAHPRLRRHHRRRHQWRRQGRYHYRRRRNLTGVRRYRRHLDPRIADHYRGRRGQRRWRRR